MIIVRVVVNNTIAAMAAWIQSSPTERHEHLLFPFTSQKFALPQRVSRGIGPVNMGFFSFFSKVSFFLSIIMVKPKLTYVVFAAGLRNVVVPPGD